jgi:hypothetical protein
MPNHKSADKNTSSKYIAKSELDRLSTVLGKLTQDAQTTKALPASDSIDENSPVLTMSSIGQLGRFANQLFQYAFLRICAQQSGARVECPAWVGQTLFGHQDAPISQRLPPEIEIKNRDVEQSLFDVVPAFIPYLEKLADAQSSRIGSDALNTGLVNVDLWGFCKTSINAGRGKCDQEKYPSLVLDKIVT